MSRCRERYTIDANIFFLVCNRESEHPGIHRDNAVGLYWHKTAPPLEWIELPPAPPDCICYGAGVQPNCLAHESVDPGCTCPSGDGSLRWPCPAHPPAGPTG